MPVDAIAAQNAFLDNTLGPNRGPATPATLNIALYYGDPRDGGVEVSGSGYARVSWSSANWGPADEGRTWSIGAASFPTPTAAYADTVTFFGGHHPTTGELWLSGALAEPLDVTAAGGGPVLVNLAVLFADAVTND